MQPDYFLSKKRGEAKATRLAAKKHHDRYQLELTVMPSMDDIKYAEIDSRIALRMGNEFVRQYPGHGWHVYSDIQNGIIKIYNSHISAKIGWIWKTKDLNWDTLNRDVCRVGGEMLRRCGLKAGALREEDLIEIQLKPEMKRADLS